YAKSIFTAISTIRDIRFLSWIGDDVCRCAGPGSDASTSIQYWHESENGGHYGRFSDSLDLLRTTDRFSTRCRMEHDCSVDQFFKRRRLFSFRAQRKSPARG